MARTVPPQLVEGAPRSPLPFGLFSALAFRPSGERWEGGVAWEEAHTGPLGGIGDAGYNDDPAHEVIGYPKELGKTSRGLQEATPFTVYGRHVCSPVGATFEEGQRLANTHLLTREEARVEQALWTGDLGNVPNFAGAHGATAPTDLGSATAKGAIDELELHLAKVYGAVGVMHMARNVASYLLRAGALETRGGSKLFTKLGTPVVAGTGYGIDKIVGTSALLGYRSEIITSSETPGDLFETRQNNLTAIAERTYTIGYGPAGLAAVTITAPTSTTD